MWFADSFELVTQAVHRHSLKVLQSAVLCQKTHTDVGTTPDRSNDDRPSFRDLKNYVSLLGWDA